MYLIQAGLLLGKAGLFGGVFLVRTAGFAFVVVQLRIGSPHNTPAFFPQAQAEIHIVECNSKGFIQPANGIISRCAHQQAGRSAGGIILHGGQAEHVPATAALVVLVAVARIPTQTGDNARVLDGIVRVIQHGAAGRHAGLAGFGHHLGQPVSADDFNIVVEQQ